MVINDFEIGVRRRAVVLDIGIDILDLWVWIVLASMVEITIWWVVVEIGFWWVMGFVSCGVLGFVGRLMGWWWWVILLVMGCRGGWR